MIARKLFELFFLTLSSVVQNILTYKLFQSLSSLILPLNPALCCCSTLYYYNSSSSAVYNS